eukprot:g3493.t1
MDFKKGYSMFLYGPLVGEVREDVIYTGDHGSVRRYDGTANRYFSGKIAEVMFFDQPLSEPEINSLYVAALSYEPGFGGGRRELTQKEENSAFQGLPPGSRFGKCADQDLDLNGLDSQTQDYESKLNRVPILSPNSSELARTGVCVQLPPSRAYVFDSGSEIDGVLVNEANNSAATGEYQMLLTSPIHLCGRVDGNNGTYFDSNLAHLILWDVPLTKMQLFAIYERYILAAESVQIEHPQNQTINSDQC